MSWRGRWWWATMSWASWMRARGQCPSGASCLTPRSVEMGTPSTSLCTPQTPPPAPTALSPSSLTPRRFTGTWHCWSWRHHWPPRLPSALSACPVALWSQARALPATSRAGGPSMKVGATLTPMGVYGASPSVPSADAPSQGRGMQKRGGSLGMGHPVTGVLPGRGAGSRRGDGGAGAPAQPGDMPGCPGQGSAHQRHVLCRVLVWGHRLLPGNAQGWGLLDPKLKKSLMARGAGHALQPGSAVRVPPPTDT